MSKFLDEAGESLVIGRNQRQSLGVIKRTADVSGLALEIGECQKRVQIAHSGKVHVALFIKKVKAEAFSPIVQPLLEGGIHIGGPGETWQSVRISVPEVDPQLGLETQIEALSEVFDAARCLYDFFLKHEAALLSIPTFK